MSDKPDVLPHAVLKRFVWLNVMIESGNMLIVEQQGDTSLNWSKSGNGPNP